MASQVPAHGWGPADAESHEVSWDAEAGRWRCHLCRTSAQKLWDLGPGVWGACLPQGRQRGHQVGAAGGSGRGRMVSAHSEFDHLKFTNF